MLAAPRSIRCLLAQLVSSIIPPFLIEPRTRPHLGSLHLNLCADVLEQQSGNPDLGGNNEKRVPSSIADKSS